MTMAMMIVVVVVGVNLTLILFLQLSYATRRYANVLHGSSPLRPACHDPSFTTVGEQDDCAARLLVMGTLLTPQH